MLFLALKNNIFPFATGKTLLGMYGHTNQRQPYQLVANSVYLQAKNQLHASTLSKEIPLKRIQQPDWLSTIWPISQEPRLFPVKQNLCRHIANNTLRHWSYSETLQTKFFQKLKKKLFSFQNLFENQIF